MCRFTIYVGPPVRIASLLTEPTHSLIHQSFHSEERSEPLNGDGFGVGWYAPRLTPDPAIFRAIHPAWNDRNLKSIARVVTSPCILAHVRAASAGSEVNLANCHPFAHRQYLLMHNGHVGDFRRVRRRLLEGLSDEAFDVVRGSTDTEHVFAAFIDEVLRAPADGQDATLALARCLSAALARVLRQVRDDGDGEPSFLNIAVADGTHAVVTRFADDPNEGPESLYLLRGELYEPAGRRFPQRRPDDEGEPFLVSSERLTDDARWEEVPANHAVLLDRWGPVRVLPMSVTGELEM